MGGDYSMLSDSVIDETPILTTKVSWTTKIIISSVAAVAEPSHFGSASNFQYGIGTGDFMTLHENLLSP